MTSLPADIPSEAIPFLQEAGWLEADQLAVGSPAPDVPLFTLDGVPTRLGGAWVEKPAVLIFGSYT